jgi:hypothetical protein
VIITNAEMTKSVFTHGEPLYRLQLYCVERGDITTANAVVSGFTPVTVTGRRGEPVLSSQKDNLMLNYTPKGDPKQGLKV